MKRSLIAILIAGTAFLGSGCLATRKFTRNEVKTTADTINARIDTTDANVKETQDHVNRVDQRVTTVDGRVTELDTKTTQGMNTLKTDITGVSTNVSQVASNVNTVSGKVDQTNSNLNSLDEKFQKRNNLSVATEKSVPFKFDSAALDPAHQPDLDEVADMLIKNPDAIIVLEGRTDATGNDEYNVQLGERRVESVRRYLAVVKHVPVYKIHEVSFGSAEPIADNESRDGREKNRSVKLMVLVPSMNASAAVR